MTPAYELVLEPGRAESRYWRDLWAYRELLLFLAWRDISVRYKQTLIGVAWALIQPLAIMLVFTFTFGRVAGMAEGSAVPYMLIVMVGTLSWQFFSTGFSACSGSLVANANMLTKIYFPRLLVPAGSVFVSLVDFMITLGLLVVIALMLQFVPDWRVLFLPLFALLTFLLALGIGIWFATLNVQYRDFRYIVPFCIQFGVFVSPVGYPTSALEGSGLVRVLYYLNPMAGAIDGFRWSFLGMEPYWPGVAFSSVLAVVLCVSGCFFFRRMERTFADVI